MRNEDLVTLLVGGRNRPLSTTCCDCCGVHYMVQPKTLNALFIEDRRNDGNVPHVHG